VLTAQDTSWLHRTSTGFMAEVVQQEGRKGRCEPTHEGPADRPKAATSQPAPHANVARAPWRASDGTSVAHNSRSTYEAAKRASG
jgi:hypothetical protein